MTCGCFKNLRFDIFGSLHGTRVIQIIAGVVPAASCCQSNTSVCCGVLTPWLRPSLQARSWLAAGTAAAKPQHASGCGNVADVACPSPSLCVGLVGVRMRCVAQVHALLAAGIPVAGPQYVVEWLAQPWRPPAAHLLFGSALGPALADAEADRAGAPGADEGSMSF